MHDLTQILRQVEQGDPAAAEQLLPLVYDDLRKLATARLAQEKPGQTLQATALVHEAYMRMLNNDEGWNGRAHFFGTAAEAMRRILVENARRKQRLKHGGGLRREAFGEARLVCELPDDELIALDEALSRLQQSDAEITYLTSGLTPPTKALPNGAPVVISVDEEGWMSFWNNGNCMLRKRSGGQGIRYAQLLRPDSAQLFLVTGDLGLGRWLHIGLQDNYKRFCYDCPVLVNKTVSRNGRTQRTTEWDTKKVCTKRYSHSSPILKELPAGTRYSQALVELARRRSSIESSDEFARGRLLNKLGTW